MPQHLKTYTSLWAMQPHDQTGVKLPYDQVCEMVANAGYDGMAIDLGAGDVAQAHEVRPHMERHGLTPLIVAFPKTVEGLRETLFMAKDFGSPFLLYGRLACHHFLTYVSRVARIWQHRLISGMLVLYLSAQAHVITCCSFLELLVCGVNG